MRREKALGILLQIMGCASPQNVREMENNRKGTENKI